LSGGQRQRLAIARSIVGDPAILILDEATSSIDVRGERIVQHALERVSQNRTTIVIAHRLSTVQKADNIIVMRDGRKREEGTHEHLLSIPDGLYAGLVHAQQLEREHAPEQAETDEGVDEETIQRKDTKRSVEEKTQDFVAIPYKDRGFFRSVGYLLYEQRKYWKLYVAIVVAAMGAGCKNFPIHLQPFTDTTISGIFSAKLDLCPTDPGVSSYGQGTGPTRQLLVPHVFRPGFVYRLVLLLAHVLLQPPIHGKLRGSIVFKVR
jgi:hypothetical protein